MGTHFPAGFLPDHLSETGIWCGHPEIHTHFLKPCHQRITHIIAGIPEVAEGYFI